MARQPLKVDLASSDGTRSIIPSSELLPQMANSSHKSNSWVEERILLFLKEKGEAKQSDLVIALSRPRTTILPYLENLIRIGVVIERGKSFTNKRGRPGSVYVSRLKEEFDSMVNGGE